MSKKIQLGSGSFITRMAGDGYDEIWEVENKSLSTIEVTLDLSKCTGVEVDGFEGENAAVGTCPAQETQTLFNIRRNPPFKFAISLTVKEIPIPPKEQKKYIAEKSSGLEGKIREVGEVIKGLPFDVMSHEDIIAKLDENGIENFIDPSFPPDMTSIYDKNTEPSYPLQEKPVWKRPHEFMHNPQLYVGGIDPNDINQGALGNCWFLASIASVSENPALIKRLFKYSGCSINNKYKYLLQISLSVVGLKFITKEYNEKGIYQLRICKNGEWVKVTVDDYIPCYYAGGPMFCRATGDELWVLLLEKAYAKLHGNYCQLRAGFVSHGMSDLTGCPIRDYRFPKPEEITQEYKADLWKKLTFADERGWIMCAGTAGVDNFTEKGGPRKTTGIVPGHAYSVIACKEYNNIKLMKVRNPWGQFEWGGAWSDNSKEWTQEMRDAFQPSFDANDGTFWISYKDFIANFCSITICKVENWRELRLKGIFLRVFEEEDKDEDFVLSKFYYSFHLEEETIIEIGLHQEDDRIMGADRRRYTDMQILVLKRHANGTLTIEHDSLSSTDRDCETLVTLSAGHYIVIPRTCGATISKPNNNPKGPIEYKVEYHGNEKLHPELRTTIDDIFRRVDLQMNGALSAEELNQLGNIVDNEKLKSIT